MQPLPDHPPATILSSRRLGPDERAPNGDRDEAHYRLDQPSLRETLRRWRSALRARLSRLSRRAR